MKPQIDIFSLNGNVDDMNEQLGIPRPQPKRACKFSVGDKVSLTSQGYRVFKPSNKEEARAAIMGSIVREINPLDDNIWLVDVEGPLSGHLFDDTCFQLVKPKE